MTKTPKGKTTGRVDYSQEHSPSREKVEPPANLQLHFSQITKTHLNKQGS